MSRSLVALALISLIAASPGCLFPPVDVLAPQHDRLPVGGQQPSFTVEDSDEEMRALTLQLTPAPLQPIGTEAVHSETFELPTQLTYLAVRLDWADPVADLDLAVDLTDKTGRAMWNESDDRGAPGSPDGKIEMSRRDARCEAGLCADQPSQLVVSLTVKGAASDLQANLSVAWDYLRTVTPVVGRFDAAGDTRIRVGETEATSQQGRWIARRTIEIEEDPKAFHSKVHELAVLVDAGQADVTVRGEQRNTVLFTIVQESHGANRDAAVRAMNEYEVPYQNVLSKGDERVSMSLGLRVRDDDWTGKEATVHVAVPAGYEQMAQATTTTGRIEARNLTAANVAGLTVDLKTDSGPLHVEGYGLGNTGAMRLTTATGTVTARQVEARALEVDTTEGDSDLRGIRLGSLSLTSTSGTHVTFGMEVSSLSVSVAGGAFDGTVQPRASASWRLEATTGKLDLDMESGAAAGYDITADTGSGSVRIRCKGDPWVESQSARTQRHCGRDPGDPALDVRLKTTSGNIVVREV